MSGRQSGEKAQRIEGHLVANVDGRFKCLLCGAKLLAAIQFSTAECRGVRRTPLASSSR